VSVISSQPILGTPSPKGNIMFIEPNNTVEFDLPLGQVVALYSGPGTGTAVIQKLFDDYSVQKVEQLASATDQAVVVGPFTDNIKVRVIAGDDLAEVSYGPAAEVRLSNAKPIVFGDLTPVSIVQPASTFVTLTYSDNGGSVQLDSAGAHGLTAAVAVGKNVFVTWAGGTGVDGFYEITALDADTTGVEITIDLPFVAGLGTPTVAVADTEVTLASVTIPGWSMGVGGGMEIDSLFSLTNSATAKNIGLSYGGGVLMAVSAANNASACTQKLMCNRGSSQIISNAANQVGHGLSTGANVVLSVDATQDQVFAFTAKPAAANNVVTLEAFKIVVSF
jgi:hypothetical protein